MLGRSRAQTFPSLDQEGRGVAEEGIVPGLDFCNHDFAAPCRWTVFGARRVSWQHLKMSPILQ